MSTPYPWAPEFLVNTTTESFQAHPSIAATRNGRFVAVWTDFSPANGSSPNIAAQIFNANGSKFGQEFLVNTSFRGRQYQPRVAELRYGGFVVAWEVGGQNEPVSKEIRAQVFDANGKRIGNEKIINQQFREYALRDAFVTGLADGGFIFGSEYFEKDREIHKTIVGFDRYDKNGEKLSDTGTFLDDQDGHVSPEVASLEGGGYVIVYHQTNQAPQAFVDPTGDFDDSITINITDKPYFLNPVPVVAGLPNGGFVVAWMDEEYKKQDILAQRFSQEGNRVGSIINIDTGNSYYKRKPDITALPDGRFVVSWPDFGKRGSDKDQGSIMAQVFNSNGTKSGSIFQINATTKANQDEIAIASLRDGRIVGAWQDESNTGADTSLSAIRGRIIEPRLTGLQLNGTFLSDDLIGSPFSDRINGLPGNDQIVGGAGQDILNGAEGDDQLDGGGGNDVLIGGEGNDTFYVDSIADKIIETSKGGQDEIRTSSISLNLANSNLANVEHATLLGSATLSLIGSSLPNRLVGNTANNIIRGGAGADSLTGLAGSDLFILDQPSAADIISDFRSGVDQVHISQKTIPIGNRDLIIDNPTFRDSPHNFSVSSELIIFTQDILGPITTAKAAAAIGRAASLFRKGDTRLFSVDNGTNSSLYQFTSSAADRNVSASELRPLAHFHDTPSLGLSDIALIAA
jgi:hypothetical protein